MITLSFRAITNNDLSRAHYERIYEFIIPTVALGEDVTCSVAILLDAESFGA